jgi:hypothetical protein
MLPGMSLDGVLHVDVVEGSYNFNSFDSFISGLLSRMDQYPGPNSVIVMDNCRIHKNPATLQKIIDR